MLRNILRIQCAVSLRRSQRCQSIVNRFQRCSSTKEANNFAQTARASSVAPASIADTAAPHEEPTIATGTSDTKDDATAVVDREKRFKILQLEADISRQEGRRVPSLDFFQDHHWAHILGLPSKSARYKYYAYLWQVEVKKESAKRKKLIRAEEIARRKEQIQKDNEQNNHIIYGLSHTTLFLRIYDTTINLWMNNRLTRAMQFAPKIVLDCSYDEYMTRQESTNAAKQLMLCFAENRSHDDPFDLHFCNVNRDTVCMKALYKFIPRMHDLDFPMNVSDECFTKMFPKERLVYLTPHCREELHTYDPDDIYIIGAMIDSTNKDPLSLAKAKRLGLRMACLPLDRYLQWGSGSGKCMTLNQMVNIMLDLKKTGDWEQALKHVPRRKVADTDYQMMKQRRDAERQANRLNFRFEKVFDSLGKRQVTHKVTPEQLRSHKKSLEFNLDTWGKEKKKRNQN